MLEYTIVSVVTVAGILLGDGPTKAISFFLLFAVSALKPFG